MSRQRYKCLALVILGLALPTRVVLAPACENPPPSKHLSVKRLNEEMDQWCWAASAEMIMRYLGGKSPAQCEMASLQSHRKGCCTKTGFGTFPDLCNVTGWPPFGDYDYAFQQTHYEALTFAQLQEQMFCKGKPVAFSLRNIVNGQPVDEGHMYVAIGYSVDSNGKHVEVNDPAYATYRIMLYDEYVAVPGQTAHWDDFYDITKHP